MFMDFVGLGLAGMDRALSGPIYQLNSCSLLMSCGLVNTNRPIEHYHARHMCVPKKNCLYCLGQGLKL
ncbi:hypothetical protein GLYMA_06G295600v4 [Glycine max]|uniref:Uncharacterized protein n=1 Tax=Glycine max TaxID=3847 RepID=K7KY51_SOYBN|nr:hypothetical protein GYH30_016626 [Glycine max]KRH56000.1 hypothetical protein GLYMA_06G295600v4 [Glycine max]